MKYLAWLDETLGAKLRAGSIGKPVFVRANLQLVTDHGHLISLASSAVESAAKWIGSPVRSIYAQGGAKQGFVSLLVDFAAMKLVSAPAEIDVLVTENLFGDILTDLAGAVTGGIGLAASGNINPDGAFPSMFEPVHGSAPDIYGRGIANPVAMVWSAAMMLDFLGERAAHDEQGGGELHGRTPCGGWLREKIPENVRGRNYF